MNMESNNISQSSHSPPQRLFDSTCENQVKRKSGASATKRAVLGTKVGVLGMCNNNNGSDSREQNLCSNTHVICRFLSRGRTKLGVAQGSDKSLTGLEL